MAPSNPDIPLFDLRLEEADIQAVVDTLRSGWLTMGPRTVALEQAFADHLGVAHAIAVSSGTAALHLALSVAGVGPGDEVIVPGYTFVATVNAVLYCGADPVFADIRGLEDPSIDPDEVRRLISPRTRAVVAVHFAGYPAAVDVLAELCHERGVALIEDAAHAPEAELEGHKLGTFGRVGAFSFFSNKVLSVGEGGALVTDDEELAARARGLRSHAMTSSTWDRHLGHADTYDVVDLGFNYRIDEPRAALALARLPRVAGEVHRRRALTLAYRQRLRGITDLVIPYRDQDVARSSCYVMPVMVRSPDQRAPLREELRLSYGIQTSVLYPAVHEFSVYRRRYPGVSLPLTEQAARCELTLPLFPHMTEEQQGRVIGALEQIMGPPGERHASAGEARSA